MGAYTPHADSRLYDVRTPVPLAARPKEADRAWDGDTYTGAALPGPTVKLEDNVRGEAKQAGAIAGLWVDVDYEDEHAHRKANLPSFVEARDFVQGVDPTPTITVRSGHGYQVAIQGRPVGIQVRHRARGSRATVRTLAERTPPAPRQGAGFHTRRVPRVEKAREKVLVLLEQQGETDLGLSPDVLYADHERAGTLQEELPTPVRVRVSILNRQAQGLRMFLAALQQEKLTVDEVEELGGDNITKMVAWGTAQADFPVDVADADDFVGIVKVMRLEARETMAARRTMWQRAIDGVKQVISPRPKRVN